jgi:integrase
MQSQVTPRTIERYGEIARKNLVPILGNAVLNKLQPEHISGAYVHALRSGHRDGSGGLAPRTVHHMHRLLKQALRQAVNWGMLHHNPADLLKPPKVERVQMKALEAAEIAGLLAHFRPTRMFVPALLAVTCGLRRGEICALKWRTVDLALAQISLSESVEQTTKGLRTKETKSGRSRTVDLPSIVVDELRRHRLRQAEEMLKVGVRADEHTPVVSRETGEPLQPNSLTHEFVRILSKAPGLPRIRFHDLRHTHATQLLSVGVHPKIAQERLGHSTVSITLDLYSHVMPGMQQDAAACKVDAALHAAIEKG